MVVVVGINQVIIIHGKNVAGGHIGSGQTYMLRLQHFKYFLLIIVQVPALLVAKVGRGLPVTNDLYGIIHSDGTMIRGNNYPDIMLVKLF